MTPSNSLLRKLHKAAKTPYVQMRGGQHDGKFKVGFRVVFLTRTELDEFLQFGERNGNHR